MHLFHIPQCNIQNRNFHISVLNGVLWDIRRALQDLWIYSVMVAFVEYFSVIQCGRMNWKFSSFSADHWEYFAEIFLNSSPLGQNCCQFTDNIFKCIFLNENVWISIMISLKFVPKGPINYILALDQIMAWCRIGDKPLFELILIRFPDAYMQH